MREPAFGICRSSSEVRETQKQSSAPKMSTALLSQAAILCLVRARPGTAGWIGFPRCKQLPCMIEAEQSACQDGAVGRNLYKPGRRPPRSSLFLITLHIHSSSSPHHHIANQLFTPSTLLEQTKSRRRKSSSFPSSLLSILNNNSNPKTCPRQRKLSLSSAPQEARAVPSSRPYSLIPK